MIFAERSLKLAGARALSKGKRQLSATSVAQNFPLSHVWAHEVWGELDRD